MIKTLNKMLILAMSAFFLAGCTSSNNKDSNVKQETESLLEEITTNETTSSNESENEEVTTTATEESSEIETNVELETESQTEIQTETNTETESFTDSFVLDGSTENNRDVYIEAKAIIERANTYTDFSSKDYLADPSSFFLKEYDQQAYHLILDDLSQKTDFAHEKIYDFYENVDTFFSNEDEELDDLLFSYYRYIAIDTSKIEVMSYEPIFMHFADDTMIIMEDLQAYIPYYLWECSVDETKKVDINSMIEEMCSLKESETFLATIPAHDVYTMIDYIPYAESLFFMGKNHETFQDISEHKLIFSSPITVEDYATYEYFNMTVECAYVIPFYDETIDLYGIANFDSQNNLIKVSY